MACAALSAPPEAPPSEQFRHLAAELLALENGIWEGEGQEAGQDFARETFWRSLHEASAALSTEARSLAAAFSRPPLPSPQETQRFCEKIHASIKTIIAIYYSFPKDQD